MQGGKPTIYRPLLLKGAPPTPLPFPYNFMGPLPKRLLWAPIVLWGALQFYGGSVPGGNRMLDFMLFTLP